MSLEGKNSLRYSYSVCSIKIFNIRFINCLLYSTLIVRYSLSGTGNFKNANQINVDEASGAGTANPPGAPEFVPVLRLMGFVLFNVVKLHVFTFLVSCCDVSYDFHLKTMFGSSLFTFVMWGGGSCFIYIVVFIYIYWCPTRFPCQMVLC